MSAPRVVSHCPCDPIGASFLYSLKVWGDPKTFCSDVVFLLVLPKEAAVGERVYGLAMVWVYPYQARVSTIDNVARQLAQLSSTGLNWPYVLVWLNSDAHHFPFPTEGHLSVMKEGNASNVPCRKICILEVHQLLSSGSQVVYLEGLSGFQVPVIMSLPESLSNSMTMLKGESTFLQEDLSQSSTKEQESKTLSLGGGLSPTRAPPKQKAKSACPWRWVISYPRQFWTLLV